MTARTSRRVGVALILGAAATAADLHLAGVGLFRFHAEGGLLDVEFSVHWATLVLATVALAGLLFLVWPPRPGHPPALPK